MCRVRLLAFSGCHKLALGSLVPPRKWSQKADVAKQWAFILTEKTAIVSVKHTQCTVKGCIEIRKLIHLAKNISLSSNKHHHYFLFFFIPPLISVTDLFGLQTQLLCVCERERVSAWAQRSTPVEITVTTKTNNSCFLQRVLQSVNYSINLNFTCVFAVLAMSGGNGMQ